MNADIKKTDIYEDEIFGTNKVQKLPLNSVSVQDMYHLSRNENHQAI